jgi:hypothetical protein
MRNPGAAVFSDDSRAYVFGAYDCSMGWQFFFWILAAVLAFAGFVMSLARTPPEDAISNLSLWAEWCGIHRIPPWLRDRHADDVAFRWARLATITTIILIVSGGAYLTWPPNIQTPSNPGASPSLEGPKAVTPAPHREDAPTATPRPTVDPNDIRRFVLDGLGKARADLLSIRKEDLSCAALSAWQQRADAATRLAHANGIGVHNPISQYLGACGNTTDLNLLEALRGSIVKLLDQGMQAAGG